MEQCDLTAKLLVLIVCFIDRSSLSSVKIRFHPKDLLTKHAAAGGGVQSKYEAVFAEESVVAFFPPQ